MRSSRSTLSTLLAVAATAIGMSAGGFAPAALPTAPRRNSSAKPTRRYYGLTKEQRLWNEQVEARKAAKKANRLPRR